MLAKLLNLKLKKREIERKKYSLPPTREACSLTADLYFSLSFPDGYPSLIHRTSVAASLHPISKRSHCSSFPKPPPSTYCFISSFKQSLLVKAEVTPARKAERMKTDIHLSHGSSWYSPPNFPTALKQNTYCSLHPSPPPTSYGSHRSPPSNLCLPTHCFIWAPNPSGHSLLGHRPLLLGKEVGWL